MKTDNYLHSLLSALTETELETLATIKLRGKEQELYGYYLSYKDKPLPAKDVISKSLAMSPSHIDKTTSVVLKKCYEALSGEDTNKLWSILRYKHLPRSLYHSLALTEREALRTNDRKLIAIFYKDAFECIHTLSYQDYDQREAERLKQCYYKFQSNVSNDERLMIEGRHIRQLIINSVASSKNLEQFKSEITEKISGLETTIDDSVSIESLIQFYLAIALFYKQVEINEEKQREYLTRCKDIIHKDREHFPFEDIPILELKIADTYFQESNFAEAYKQYSEIVPPAKDLIRTQFFHLTTYAHLATLCKEFNDTASIVKEFFSPYYDSQNWQVQTMADITLAKCFFYSGDLVKAKKHIDSGFLINDKGILISFDLELRKLETLYFALSGDFGFAEDLITKHIKFLHSKKISVKVSLHGKFFKVMRDIIEERTTGKRLSATAEALLAEQSSSFQAIYGMLLREIRK